MICQARADFNVSADTLARAVSLGRRSNFPRGPVSVGEPRIVVRTRANLRATAFGTTPYDYHSKFKDLFWYIEKAFEGTAGQMDKQAALRQALRLDLINDPNYIGNRVDATGKGGRAIWLGGDLRSNKRGGARARLYFSR